MVSIAIQEETKKFRYLSMYKANAELLQLVTVTDFMFISSRLVEGDIQNFE